MATPTIAAEPPPRQPFKPQWYVVLGLVFAVSLAIRVHGVFTMGFGYLEPETFRVVNFDEAGGCRALLGGRKYNKFVGYQILAIQHLMGESPEPKNYATKNNPQAWREFCHSKSSIILHRVYSAVTGSLTVVLLGVLALLMWPERPQIAWTACSLLGFSNLHVAHSAHFGTVDAPQLFFMGLLTTALAYAIVSKSQWPLWISPLLLIAAVWTKSNIFMVLAFVPLLPSLKLSKYPLQYAIGVLGFFFLIHWVIGFDSILSAIEQRKSLIWGPEKHPGFCTGYGHIGTWRRWIRNGINLPVVHIVGIGLPAFVAAIYGLRQAWKTRAKDSAEWKLWLLQAPAVAYFFYMLLIAPPTYYRYYLPLFPAVALLAAYGFWESRWSANKIVVGLFLLYPALLTIDSEYNYANDPRSKVEAWLDTTPKGRDSVILETYYSGLPKNVKPGQPGSENNIARSPFYHIPGAVDRYTGQKDDLLDRYERNSKNGTLELFLQNYDYLIMDETWYDTAFCNELNGPFARNPDWCIKTTPQSARIYRKIVSGDEPALELEKALTLTHFTPEMLVHRYFYGSFPLFPSDTLIYRIKKAK